MCAGGTQVLSGRRGCVLAWPLCWHWHGIRNDGHSNDPSDNDLCRFSNNVLLLQPEGSGVIVYCMAVAASAIASDGTIRFGKSAAVLEA